jgi:Na+-translocating ferredoxin:NAD+ oxidoreductase subunit B
MNTHDEVYHRLAKVLDTLPNSFPSTESGVEIRMLKKIFTPEQADLFCDLRLKFETVQQIAQRTGRPVEGLKEKLITMGQQGQVFAIKLGESWIFKMLPWVFGIFEFQLERIDREFAEMNQEYGPIYSQHFFANKPQLMQVLPIEETISSGQEALPYEKVSALIEKSKSFMVNECICKKEHALLGKPCDRPLEVCLAMAPVHAVFKDSSTGHVISKEEAYALLKMTEEAGLVHMTNNLQNGQFFICNCCKCCCGPLRSINELGIPAWDVVNSHYYAQIAADRCISCGTCADERCQVGASGEDVGSYRITPEKCIGCGLCISTCPAQAIELVHKEQGKTVPPPVTEDEWFEERGRLRGVDFTDYA